MKSGLTLSELAKEIERRQSMKSDFVAPASKIQLAVGRDDKAILKMLGEPGSFPLNQVAHEQVADYAGIPMPYYRRMQAEAPQLLVTNVNRWLEEKAGAKERRLVRTLGGHVRAVLSDKYRPLENEDLAEAILPVLLERDLIIMSCQVTDTRLYIKAVDRSIEKNLPVGKRMGDGSHHIFDCLSPAIVVSNSEVGRGSLLVEAGVYTKACTNLAVFGASMRKFHTGARAELSDEVYSLLTDKTKRSSVSARSSASQTQSAKASCRR
jgi:hypothetical protein